ncbi:hypothetical protein VTI74DRAFT_9410 [Chaetomium olivicolor]
MFVDLARITPRRLWTQRRHAALPFSQCISCEKASSPQSSVGQTRDIDVGVPRVLRCSMLGLSDEAEKWGLARPAKLDVAQFPQCANCKPPSDWSSCQSGACMPCRKPSHQLAPPSSLLQRWPLTSAPSFISVAAFLLFGRDSPLHHARRPVFKGYHLTSVVLHTNAVAALASRSSTTASSPSHIIDDPEK